MQVKRSSYLVGLKPTLQKLENALLDAFPYASVLAADVDAKNYSVSGRGTNISEVNRFGKRGIVARVYSEKGYLEYSVNSLSEADIPTIVAYFQNNLKAAADHYDRLETVCTADTPQSFVKSTEYEIDPAELGDEAIIDRLTALRGEILSKDERLMEAHVAFDYQIYHKIFLSKNRDMEENVMFASSMMMVMARRGQELKDSYKAVSNLGGAEVLDHLKDIVPAAVNTVIDLLSAEPMVPGEYECICAPEVTGMIVHEAFGHGVEMDMFVKDRALAREYVGQ